MSRILIAFDRSVMLMKMMSQQGPPMPPISLGDPINDHSTNGEQDSCKNTNGVAREVLCEPELDMTSEGDRKESAIEDDQSEENRSVKSERSNQASEETEWSSKATVPLSCALCAHCCATPGEFEEHIKAHLHAASAGSSPMSAAKTADVLS